MFKILRGYMVNDKFLAETSTGFLNDKTYIKTIVSSEGRTCKLTKKIKIVVKLALLAYDFNFTMASKKYDQLKILGLYWNVY